jgi:glycosyltransferase involved in cell wall biosynthesis
MNWYSMDLRIAILTGDEFSVLGGAERHMIDAAFALEADIVCPGYNKGPVETYDPERQVKFISLDKKLPKEPLRQLSGKWLFRQISLNYDFYIAMDDMAVEYLRKGRPHLYYMFTPRRALYDMYYPFLEEVKPVKRPFYSLALGVSRKYDRHFVKKYVKNFAANSHNVRNRIFKAYQRNAEVIYPPVHTEKYQYRPSEGYWLSVGRVDKWKRVDLQIEAFRKMPDKQLFIVGPVYPQYQYLVDNAPKNVRFLGTVEEGRLFDLYSRCEGLIATAIDEDFGLTPVEAMASGKPVVATREGGYLESVVEGYTGILVKPDMQDICQAVMSISKCQEKYRDCCQERAKIFDYSVFKKLIIKIIEDIHKH